MTNTKLKYSQPLLDAAAEIENHQVRAEVLMTSTHNLPIEEAHAVLDAAASAIDDVADPQLRVTLLSKLAGSRSRVDQRLDAIKKQSH